ncbi:hypothetical protein AB0I35_30645 [Nocardia sp. NPDC050378]|uniref:hypothetical protein n=1 Tax=Nocardia sp. NPDC050378 TaxID=3155400 RepID=UPI0033D2F51B
MSNDEAVNSDAGGTDPMAAIVAAMSDRASAIDAALDGAPKKHRFRRNPRFDYPKLVEPPAFMGAKVVMANFSDFYVSDPEHVRRLDVEWERETQGRRTGVRCLRVFDEDRPGRHLSINMFATVEDWLKNNYLPAGHANMLQYRPYVRNYASTQLFFTDIWDSFAPVDPDVGFLQTFALIVEIDIANVDDMHAFDEEWREAVEAGRFGQRVQKGRFAGPWVGPGPMAPERNNDRPENNHAGAHVYLALFSSRGEAENQKAWDFLERLKDKHSSIVEAMDVVNTWVIQDA